MVESGVNHHKPTETKQCNKVFELTEQLDHLFSQKHNMNLKIKTCKEYQQMASYTYFLNENDQSGFKLFLCYIIWDERWLFILMILVKLLTITVKPLWQMCCFYFPKIDFSSNIPVFASYAEGYWCISVPITNKGPRGRDCVVARLTTTKTIKCLSPLTLWVRISPRRNVLDTTLCDTFCQ